MTQLHDCLAAGCSTKPDGTVWAVPPTKTGACVWNNNNGKLITRAAAKAISPKEEVEE